MILADIYDMLALINANLVAVGSHSRTKKPQTYPRPRKDKGNHYGSDPVSIEELRKLAAEKRKRHMNV